MLASADVYTQLAGHALAHVPLRGAASLHRSEYVHWAREALPAEAWRPIADDAAAIAGLHEATGRPLAMQHLFELYDDVGAFRREARAAIEELEAARSDAVRAIGGEPSAELVRGAMLQMADGYARSWPRAECEAGVDAVAPWIEEGASLVPALGGARVELVWALGARGRAFGARVLVGVPGDWAGTRAETVAVLAMHEAAVRAAVGDYAEVEHAGLTEVARAMTAASGPLRDAHAAWLGALSFDALTRRWVTRGLVDAERAHAIRERPGARAALLASS